MKLLIVDDSSLIRRSINAAYSGSVFTEIQTAVDGMLAVTIFKKMLPDVVTLDITMPHMDGLAAMTKMLDIKPNTIILVISALADHHTAIEALTRGAHQFICKPFDDDDLKDALDNLLEDADETPRKIRLESDDAIHGVTAGLKSAVEVSKVVSVPMKAPPMPGRAPAPPPPSSFPSGFVSPPPNLPQTDMELGGMHDSSNGIQFAELPLNPTVYQR